MSDTGGSENQWPCYRHDPARSGCAAAELPANLRLLWTRPVGGSPTAPTAAGGLVLAASRDEYRLTALDAAGGQPRWTFTAGGPIDTPPTIHAGRCFFGGRDGWVYALAAADGELIWRRRLAPDQRRIIACGRLESPVPVVGSVLAIGDRLYCSAGRSSELDGGVHVYALDPATGEVRWHANVGRSELVAGRILERRVLAEQGAYGDLLVSDGRYLYMNRWRFAMDDGRKEFHYRWPGVLEGGGKGGLLDETMKQLWSYRAAGQMLVFNERTTAGFVALRKVQNNYAYFTDPGRRQVQVFARHFAADGKPAEGDAGGWTVDGCPVAVEAMLMAGKTLLVAGPPDSLEPAGGKLQALSLADGRTLAEIDLPAAPVFDGMAAADGRLYVATTDGNLQCFGGK